MALFTSSATPLTRTGARRALVVFAALRPPRPPRAPPMIVAMLKPPPAAPLASVSAKTLFNSEATCLESAFCSRNTCKLPVPVLSNSEMVCAMRLMSNCLRVITMELPASLVVILSPGGSNRKKYWSPAPDQRVNRNDLGNHIFIRPGVANDFIVTVPGFQNSPQRA